MKFLELVRTLAARFDEAHAKGHKALHLQAPQIRVAPASTKNSNRRAGQEEHGSACWILHAR